MGIQVETSYGKIEGINVGNVVAFKGIPFARPPVGDLRFQAPQKPEPWSDVLQANAFSKSAIQSELPTETGELIGIATNGVSEDCLYLNVWTPALDDQKRPVMVWIHGGGNTVGSASQPRFDGQYLASAHDVVVVSLNYRLGAFGFLHLPEIGASGNEALLDQIAGLRWTREEIAAFGGDDSNVTVFGQSAGGFDIAALLGMPAAAGCFDKAVPMSGSLSPHTPKDRAAASATKFVEAFGGIDGLLGATAQEIHSLQGTGLGGFGPILDGEVMPASAIETVRAGTYSKDIPLMIGTTLNEGTLFTLYNKSLHAMDEAGLLNYLAPTFGDNASHALSVYRDNAGALGIGDAPLDIIGAVTTDRMFRNAAIMTAEIQATHNDVWMYLFDYQTPAANGQLHSCHSFDIPFIFGTYGIPSMKPFCGEGETVAQLSKVMMATYAAFAHTGNPNNAHLPDWPTYGDDRANMRLGTDCHVDYAPLDDIRELWDNQ
jgi:para-nitrobenzyl esterase